MAVATQDMNASTTRTVTKRPGTAAASASRATVSAKARTASTATPTTLRTTPSATPAASKTAASSTRSAPSKTPVSSAASAPVSATTRALVGAKATSGTKTPAASTGVQRSSSLKVGPSSKPAASANPSRSSTPAPARSSTPTTVRSATPKSSTPLTSATKKPNPASPTTAGAKTGTGPGAGPGAGTGAGTATVTPSRRVPATASTRTTTSIRITPGTNGSTATKPPSVGGRPPVKMTPTTIRTGPGASPVTPTSSTKPAAGSPLTAKKSSTASPTSTVSRTNSTKKTITSSPSSSRPGTKSVTSTSTPPSPLNARRVSSSSSMSIASSTSGSARIASSSSKTTTEGGAPTPVSPTELKRAIANICAKLEETTSRLKAKEDELVLVRQQLKDESACFASAAAEETASSDGGETAVPDLDFSKISSQDKETVVAALSAKEKDVARIKNHIRTLKARIQRLRLEHERKTRELDQEHARKTSEKDTELTRLHQDLSALIQQYQEKQIFRQKFDDARALHARSLQELRRIHEDKLESLGQELEVVKSQIRTPATSRKSTSGSNSSKGKKQDTEAQAAAQHEKDLVALKKDQSQEKKRLKSEHEKELSRVRADLDKDLERAVTEHQTEVKERLNYELSQIRASHSALVQERHGEAATQNMTLVLRERHQRSLQDMRSRLERENKQYLDTVQTKQQNEIATMTTRHQELVHSLETRIQKTLEQHTSDKIQITTSGEERASKATKDHFAEKVIRRAKQMEELSAIETSTKESMLKELDEVKARFSRFVGKNQDKQDKKIKEMETSYEERIAELIVEHENRVRELEDLANEQVQDALDRVEGEFERNQQIMLKSQEEEKKRLQVEHELILGALEDKLTEAENTLKATMENTRKSRKVIAEQMEELKKETEQQLISVRTSMTTLIVEHETRDKTESKEQETSRVEAVDRQKLVYQRAHAAALIKAEEDARVRREKLAQEIQALKNSVKTAHSERDKARAVIKAKEARWHEGHSAACKGMDENHESILKDVQQTAQRRLSEMTREHSRMAELYADKISSVMGAHQMELQSVHTKLSAQLKSKEQFNQQEIRTLESRLAAAIARASSSPPFVSVNKDSNSSNREQLEKLTTSLNRLQKQNQTLKNENEQIVIMMNKLQEARA
ncbi:hypothetical protein EMPS_02293 [Entomortierella parvispora]|uniref:Uncharacterized protein n=1 Tax=Entomortierella parvispora TaxID=205924 RepID=A0A9P3H4G8_9FUNG|nr:hypothetical protein EMPS_02293 [Entomortierella parvispora]